MVPKYVISEADEQYKKIEIILGDKFSKFTVVPDPNAKEV